MKLIIALIFSLMLSSCAQYKKPEVKHMRPESNQSHHQIEHPKQSISEFSNHHNGDEGQNASKRLSENQNHTADCVNFKIPPKNKLEQINTNQQCKPGCECVKVW